MTPVVRYALLGLLACGLLSAAILSSGEAQPTERSAVVGGPEEGASSAGYVPTKAQVRNLGIFRTPPEGVPQLVAQVVPGNPYGVRWAQAQELPTSLSTRVWAVPGRKFICLISLQSEGAVGATCDKARDAVRTGLATTFIDEGKTLGGKADRTIVGIVPDGATAIRATVLSGSSVVAKNRGGWFIHQDHVNAPPDVFEVVRD